jgi:hypothetical protein
MAAGRLDLAIALLGHAVTAAVAIAASLAILGARGAGQGARIVTFDPDRSVIAFIEALPEEIGEAALRDRVAGFHDAILAETAAFARANDLVLLDSAAVLTGAEDVTERILDRVLAR